METTDKGKTSVVRKGVKSRTSAAGKGTPVKKGEGVKRAKPALPQKRERGEKTK